MNGNTDVGDTLKTLLTYFYFRTNTSDLSSISIKIILKTFKLNFDFDGIYMPHGVNAIDEVDFTSFTGNAVSGIQGAAYTILGEACSESEVDTAVSASSAFTNNVGHSSTYGLRPLFAHKDDTCLLYTSPSPRDRG